MATKVTKNHGEVELIDSTSERKTSWSSMMEDFKHMCVICYDVMVRPHQLQPCGHIFCESCLRKLHKVTEARAVESYTVLFWVYCPVCRAGIDVCDFLTDLDTAVMNKYPTEYKTKFKILEQEKSSGGNSRLPTSKGLSKETQTTDSFLQRRLPPAYAPARHQAPETERPRRGHLILFSVCALCIGGLYFFVYFPLMITSSGIIKMIRITGSSVGLPVEGRVPFSWSRPLADLKKTRGLAFVLFITFMKAGLGGNFGQLRLMLFASTVVSSAGFWIYERGWKNALKEISHLIFRI